MPNVLKEMEINLNDGDSVGIDSFIVGVLYDLQAIQYVIIKDLDNFQHSYPVSAVFVNFKLCQRPAYPFDTSHAITHRSQQN